MEAKLYIKENKKNKLTKIAKDVAGGQTYWVFPLSVFVSPNEYISLLILKVLLSFKKKS